MLQIQLKMGHVNLWLAFPGGSGEAPQRCGGDEACVNAS